MISHESKVSEFEANGSEVGRFKVSLPSGKLKVSKSINNFYNEDLMMFHEYEVDGS